MTGPAARLDRAALAVLPRLHLFAAVAASNGLLRPFLRYSAALWRRSGLDPATRELVILRVAAHEDCDYELAQHLSLARRAGLSEHGIAIALNRPQPDQDDPGSQANGAGLLTDQQRHALEVTDALLAGSRLNQPAPVSAAPEPQTVAVLLLAGHYLAIARLTRCLGLPCDAPTASTW